MIDSTVEDASAGSTERAIAKAISRWAWAAKAETSSSRAHREYGILSEWSLDLNEGDILASHNLSALQRKAGSWDEQR